MESETKTSIKIPRRGESGDIEVTGQSIENVSSAMRRIEGIARSSRVKQSPTHFIGIPVRSAEIKSSFESFKVSVTVNFRCQCTFNKFLNRKKCCPDRRSSG